MNFVARVPRKRLINEIFQASAVNNPVAHRRYLESLNDADLIRRHATITEGFDFGENFEATGGVESDGPTAQSRHAGPRNCMVGGKLVAGNSAGRSKLESYNPPSRNRTRPVRFNSSSEVQS